MPTDLLQASAEFCGAVQGHEKLKADATYEWSEVEFYEAKGLYEFIKAI